MRTKYYNDGIIGNQKLTVGLTKTGELNRLFWGSADFKQFIDTFHVGIKVNDSALIYLHNDINNTYSQEYIEDTNVLRTNIINNYFNVSIVEEDFVPIDENVLVRSFKIKNNNSMELNINLLAYSKLFTDFNNDTCGYVKEDTLIQYNHDFSVCTFSKEPLYSYQINGAEGSIMSGIIGGKDYIGLSNDSAISYNLKTLKPDEEKSITILIYINKNGERCMLNELDTELNRLRKINFEDKKEETIKYWRKFVKEHDTLGINKRKIPDRIKKIYNRSILLFPLLINEKTGGVSAGIEVDEGKTKCGRYSYCWTRDAVYITRAFDIVGMKDISDKFYSIFCKETQSKNGNWEQRFYTDGRLAPSWGYQVDETASVIYGLAEHYTRTKNKKFLKDNLKMCENAAIFLEKYCEDLYNGKHEFKLPYDLWEEFEGTTLYALSSIYAAYNSMIYIYKEVKDQFNNNRLKLEQISKHLEKLEKNVREVREFILKTFYDEEKNSFVRNLNDRKIDISLLGSVIPFGVLPPKDKKVLNTIERIDMTLRTYTGGYVRYENDGYMGGRNPWPIATLWMAEYNLEAKEYKKAMENFAFVTNSCSDHGLLGEQVNNETMKPEWVIGLTWSHAMYVIVLEMLIEKGLL